MNLFEKAKFVEKQRKIPVFRQIKEIYQLCKGSKLLPNEYYDFELYTKPSFKERYSYIGLLKSNKTWNKFNELDTLKSKYFMSYIDNKLDFYNEFKSVIKQPKLITTLTVNSAHYTPFIQTPYFIKPATGYGGNDCYRVEKYDKNCFPNGYFYNGNKFSVDLKLDFKKYPCYLVQEVLKPHKELDKFTESGAIGSLRVITKINSFKEVEIVGCFTKFVGKTNVVDYTALNGNYLVGVDNKTGLLTKAYNNSSNIGDKEITELNGHKITNTSIPYYDDIINSVKQWAMIVYDKTNFKLLGWDIAVCEDDFYCLEANLRPGFASLQKANKKGYYYDIMG